MIFWVLWLTCAPRSTLAQSIDWSPPSAATSAERLLMEQIEELQRSGQFREALSSLQKLYDQGGNSLIEGGVTRQLGTLKTQRYVSMREWCLQQIEVILREQVDERNHYLQQVDGAAAAALAGLQQTKDPLDAKRAAERYRSSTHGDELLLFLADLYLERGWSLRTLALAERLSSAGLRYRMPDSEPNAVGGGASTLSWPYLYAASADDAARQRVLEQWVVQRGADRSRPQSNGVAFEEVWQRALLAAAVDPQTLGHREMVNWTVAMLSSAAVADVPTLQGALDAAKQPLVNRDNPAWGTFANGNSRSTRCRGAFDLSVWPAWHHQLERYSAANDRIAASQPRVGERERGSLPYHPVVMGQRLMVNEMNRIRAYDLQTGKVWPDASPTFALFDSHISSAAYVPLGYPLVGTARGTLAAGNDCLYARMGSPVTGWANREMAEDGGSLSFLVGLDMKKQGSLVRGFPLRLLPPAFSGAEFEGCPLVWGQMLLVAIVERDNVGLRRSVAAFDRLSGELRWRSPVLAAGVVEGSDRANLITHQLLTMAGGRLYYSTNLGAIACLDPLTGEIEWLQRYQRHMEQKHRYPSPDRFKYRDLTPCMVASGLVYCMPNDCAELFALDATTGDLVWSSDDASLADAIHLLGLCGNSLLVSGDRLVWLDRLTGRQLQAYPGTTTPGVAHALPTPRGLGRGVICSTDVYWPIAGEVLVFDGDMSVNRQRETLAIRHRYRIHTGGSEGGNLIVADGHMIYCSPSRIMAFKN